MKKRIKMLSAVMAVLTVLCILGSFSTFALIDYTKTYYLNGYSAKGYSQLAGDTASVGTNSNNVSYGKKLTHTYKYITSAGRTAEIKTPVNSYVTNGNATFEVSYSVPSGSTLTGVMGQHWVKATSYMIWSSHESEDDSVVGNCEPDYSDLL